MKFGGFASGIGVHYAPSDITRDLHQSYAGKLIVGERMIPHTFVQAADARSVNIHEKLLSDSRFKIIVFVGDISKDSATEELRALETKMNSPNGFLRTYGRGDHAKVFQILCVCAASKDAVDFTGTWHMYLD